MKYLDKSFTIGKANTDDYRDGWERTFGKSPEDEQPIEPAPEELDDFDPPTCPGRGLDD